MSELLWVAVPNGLIRGSGGGPPTKASIRVLVVPRLTNVINLEEVGLEDWPDRLLNEAEFSMETRTSLGLRTDSVSPRLVPAARSEVWSGFFSGAAGDVTDFEVKTNPVPTVAPTSDDAARVAQTYRDVTRTAARPTNDAGAAVRSALRKWNAPEPQPLSEPHGQGSGVEDFHAAVAMLREHPTVLVDLGLVFEITVDVASLNVGDPQAGRELRILCSDPPSLSVLVTPTFTRYELDITGIDTGFWPAPTPGGEATIRRGMLDLSDSAWINGTSRENQTRWAIGTFDVDGVVGNLNQTGRDITKNPQAVAAMPPMRSVGLALLRPGRQRDYTNRIRTAQFRAKQSVADTSFGAEDLVLGYWLDIRREDNPWRSVCERDAAYRIDDIEIGQNRVDGFVREEGHVKPFPAIKDGNDNLHADDVVLRWYGWNMAVALPNLLGDTRGRSRTSPNKMPYDFTWEFRTARDYGDNAGRLPALRFADRYEMRVRIADITGGGLKPHDLQTDGAVSQPGIYLRHDPVQPPKLVDPGPFAPGAAVDRLVIRSDKDLSPEDLHQADGDYPLIETRALAPPTASLAVVEQHRMFDQMSDRDSFTLAQRAMQADSDEPGLFDPAVEGVNATALAEPGGLSANLSRRDGWKFEPGWPDALPKKIELIDGTDDDPITLRWLTKPGETAQTLLVTLRKAEQAIIEISSTIQGDKADHLAMKDYLSAGFGGEAISPTHTLQGRNPVVTPFRRILVVHAVRKPLAKPLWKQPLAFDRQPNDTTIVLKPNFDQVDTGTGLNTDSTGRLEVEASWTEFEDVALTAGDGRRTVTFQHLHSQSIARGDPPPMRIRHEFGDTKHRRVRYTLHATSRFREYFKSTDAQELFEENLAQPEVNVLSTARPPKPVVIGIVPGFRWQRTQADPNRIEHTRLSQRLRIELARPWFLTGEGEQLGIVLAPSGAGPAAMSGLVSRVGRDPLFGAPATPPLPTVDWFANSAAAQQVRLPEANTLVTVVPVTPQPAGDRWYADVDFAAPAAVFYNPFVQLAVARFQRDSITISDPNTPVDLRLSPVVITDTVPLLPDRRVVATRSGNEVKVTVTVDGTSPRPLNRLEVILETCDADTPPDVVELIATDNAEIQVPAWRPIRTVVRDASTGVIPFLTLTDTPGPLRLRLRETEDRLGEATGASSPDLLRRNVFVDTIVVPEEWR